MIYSRCVLYAGENPLITRFRFGCPPRSVILFLAIVMIFCYVLSRSVIYTLLIFWSLATLFSLVEF